MKRKALFFLAIFFILIIPTQAFAVDFSITNTKIDAYLLENGDTNVVEVHDYSFEGKFNGITREIIPKKGAKITEFRADEDGEPLRVEKEGHLYKVHRKGKNEHIKVKIQYTIKKGLEKNADMTEFYWPFFDNRNESSYENMTITIHPPKSTDDVIAFGYDKAFHKEVFKEDGIVQYNLGYVPANENGDIRIAYDSGLFTAMKLDSNSNIKESLLHQKEALEVKAAKFKEGQKKASSFGMIALPVMLALFSGLLLMEYIRSKRLNALVHQKVQKEQLLVPQQKMSIPATIMHTGALTSESVTAALLDLVRKGNVDQVADDEFRLVNRNVEHHHEEIVIEWLFDDMGKDGRFCTEHLNEYIDKEKNLPKYYQRFESWRKAVKKEIDNFGISENKRVVKGIFASLAFLVLPIMIIFMNYDFYFWMIITVILFIFGVSMAIFYRPLSFECRMIKREWNDFLIRLNDIKSSEWQKVSRDTRMRAIIYESGMSSKSRIESQSNLQPWQSEIGGADQSLLMYCLFTGPILTSGFNSADEKYRKLQAASNSDSSVSTGSGGGIGGGGGGSGAF
ncbi:DUF2207 domain-containing protein [Bacillus sp. FJAT-49711]|uniref:DUF2207 domain-containing protein n=1 Tax=Bacillus sp. FJAT-49711 TaxID=2833585 RepID=UPI001BC9E1C5|nr:DUF2207 domain-containing protein [Bacillus sp. FJAT-49711]MBS4221134.1 DUF2207 domain-containing protein [Bacillus sp. FJAT-49711]